MPGKKTVPKIAANMPKKVRYVIPEGDNRLRALCETCGFVNYVNPKIVVGAVIDWKKQILLCRRAIEPRKGLWTIPAGYLEEHETAEEGALREILEEAGVTPTINSLLAIYSIPHISQIQLIYRATLLYPKLEPGEETAEAQFFSWAEIPWSKLAFPSVSWALNHFKEVEGKTNFSPRKNPNNKL